MASYCFCQFIIFLSASFLFPIIQRKEYKQKALLHPRLDYIHLKVNDTLIKQCINVQLREQSLNNKVKNVKHNGNMTLEQIKKVARVIEEKSLAKTFTGIVKQVLGTALSLGATVDGQPVKQVIAKINSGELKVE